MPRFYIHTDDGDARCYDDDGCEFPDATAARVAGLKALPDMTKDKVPDGDHRTFRIEIENDRHCLVYEATLELVGTWKPDGGPRN